MRAAKGDVQPGMAIVRGHAFDFRIPFCITHSPGKMLVTDFVDQ
jgi:uncharacterized protein YcsI (UPF0317 family)